MPTCGLPRRTAPARLHSRSLTLRWAIRIAITTRRSGSTSEPAKSRTSLHRKALPSGRLGVIPPRMTREQVAVKGIPRDQLRGFPDIGQDELVRFFTLTPADVEFVASRRGRGPAQGLGLAVQLCTLPWLGFVPDAVRAAPPVAMARLGARLKVDPGVLAGYGAREQTRTDHLLAVTDYLGWKSAPAAGVAAKELEELEEFVACRAMEHDSPSLLCRRAPVHVASSLGGSGRD